MKKLFNAAALALILLGCGESPEFTVDRQKAVKWLSEYYNSNPIGGGWRVQSVGIKEREVTVSLMVPDSSPYSKMGYEQKARVFSVAIPSSLEEVWRILPPDDLIGVDVSAPGDSNFYYTHSKGR